MLFFLWNAFGILCYIYIYSKKIIIKKSVSPMCPCPNILELVYSCVSFVCTQFSQPPLENFPSSIYQLEVFLLNRTKISISLKILLSFDSHSPQDSQKRKRKDISTLLKILLSLPIQTPDLVAQKQNKALRHACAMLN